MREVKRSALVNKPPAELFALINDIESYPQFLPWCTHAQVLSRTPTEIVATIGVRQGPLHGEFTTRNTLATDRSIHLQMVRRWVKAKRMVSSTRQPSGSIGVSCQSPSSMLNGPLTRWR